jgi:5-histidylcysteine sulfoxide synthase/putative 4-mercaptohistidine N1-methyltranferase
VNIAQQTRNPNLDLNLRHANSQNSDDQLIEIRKNWWTGLAPLPGMCPGVDSTGVIHSTFPPNLNTCTRAEVKAYFDNTWTLTEALFKSLACRDAFYTPPYHNLRHPLIFYYCHPASVYINKLRVAGILTSPVNAYFEQLFETGVDEMSWDDLSKNEMEWPNLIESHAYRTQVYQILSNIIDSHTDLNMGHAPITMDHPLWALFMGLEHERIHLETSSVLMRELPIAFVNPAPEFPALHPSVKNLSNASPRAGVDYPKSTMQKIDAGVANIGKNRAWPTFGWDNEYGQRQVRVPEFETSKFLVSNGNFWEFVAAGGYRDESLWSQDGWKWRQYRNVKWPTFWVPDGPQGSFRFKLRSCFEVTEMPWSWPAVVNYHEAKAYANWRSGKEGKAYRLPTEAEHYRMRSEVDSFNFSSEYNEWYGTETAVSNASELVHATQKLAGQPSMHLKLANFDLKFGSESPVDAQAGQTGSTGHEPKINDVFGNVWQWLEDDFNPLENFKVHPYYDDFSTPCFDGRHTMLVGGSFISTGDESSYWARFQFRPHFYQHAGFRIVQGNEGSLEKLAVYIHSSEAQNSAEANLQLLSVQLEHHYGALSGPLSGLMPGPLAKLDGYPRRLAEITKAHAIKLGLPCESAIEVGCSVGAGTFELAKTFTHVVGTEAKLESIKAAQELKGHGSTQGKISYLIKGEGDITHEAIAHTPVDSLICERVQFRHADPSTLPAEYHDFTAVILNNVIDRVPSPKALLSRLTGARGLVRPGGVLVIASAFDWCEEFTPKDLWLGGFIKDKQAVISSQELSQLLAPDFTHLETTELPLIMRQNNRSYRYTDITIMVWKRK